MTNNIEDHVWSDGFLGKAKLFNLLEFEVSSENPGDFEFSLNPTDGEAISRHFNQHKSQALTGREQTLITMALEYFAKTRQGPTGEEMRQLKSRIFRDFGVDGVNHG